MKGHFLSKYLIRDKKEDVLHSSGVAKAQAGSAIGASSAETFAQRMKMERSRKMVRRYGDSRLVTDFGKQAIRIQREEKARNDARKTELATPKGGGADKPVRSGLRTNNMTPEMKRAAMVRKNPGISR